MTEYLSLLRDKDDKTAYAAARRLMEISADSPECYPHLEFFAGLLGDEKSYVRTRGFLLCCSQARWDREGKLRELLPSLLPLLHDPKPTVVRQCLQALKEVVTYRPELSGYILRELDSLDLSGYKDSMRPLLQKDVSALRELLG